MAATSFNGQLTSYPEPISMPYSMYAATVPVFLTGLKSLRLTLDKAAAYVGDHKLSESAFLESRLVDDMLPLKRQVMIATDHVKSTLHRLAGTEMPSWPDTETTFAELQARVQKAVDLAKSFAEKDLSGSEDRAVEFKTGGHMVTLNGADYVPRYGFPNFWFHTTTAYAICRAKGVQLGKANFLGRE